METDDREGNRMWEEDSSHKHLLDVSSWINCIVASKTTKDTMFARGIKRKCFDGEEDIEGTLAGFKSVPSYNLQRQSLLDMSLVKLQLCHMLVEPNLCRSVLIANTVRQIQEEMTQDGTWQVINAQNTGQASLDRLVSSDILCRSTKEQNEGKLVPSYSGFSKDFENTPSQDIISDLSTVTSVQAPRNPQSNNVWEMENSQENRGNFQKSLDQIFETLENKNPNSVEDLFSDVDNSYYDLDTVLTGMMNNTKMGHCDVLESFSSQTTTNSNSNCKSDINELDHIVEILVES
ncbi:cell division cycle-associated protein 4 isoform X1 [Sarcophilus harrisii]|nr:cell division cycle-associated protein 4 isoform X1 [Sarcophilus harrisii]XP_031808855.1 cell division cycle-associated protein 4 isoform X1 [Sarcophilus harrisii]XP_031808856.1 cell division cycle-associated protein 4 isoform X1 [Sarcophilus harrisii]XP_031808857.1 cell division cycle-associated protein 4 isoform X1 [Sarcophilus harrisii]XP_031808858.1 cell division cycle-associated protein 4 isoform X1 [Sarcophilus harrisii]XP_031808859.1 cell division cycle-associated protein 4 isoform X